MQPDFARLGAIGGHHDSFAFHLLDHPRRAIVADAEPPLTISDREITLLAGTYVFGYGESQRIEVTAEERKGFMSMYSPLTWTRKGMMGRALVHVGDHAFYPAGVPSVRISFAEEDAFLVMTVHDPGVVLVAKKKKV